MNDSTVILNSFILSWTKYPELNWGKTQEELEEMNVLFMSDDKDQYINKLFQKLMIVDI